MIKDLCNHHKNASCVWCIGEKYRRKLKVYGRTTAKGQRELVAVRNKEEGARLMKIKIGDFRKYVSLSGNEEEIAAAMSAPGTLVVLEMTADDDLRAYGVSYERVDAKGNREHIPLREIYMSFQDRVGVWLQKCFGDDIASDKVERTMRFLEEALELSQAAGLTEAECKKVVDYVFGRPAGEMQQEVGGVMVTLAALCHKFNISMEQCGETEYIRINKPEIMEKIAAKQVTKKLFGMTSKELRKS